MRGKRTVIRDDGTPGCLPAWARDELVRRRLENYDLGVRCGQLAAELAKTRGDDPFVAAMAEVKR